MARVFVGHCITTNDEARLESALPVVTALAFQIQIGYNALLEDIQAEEERVEYDEVGSEEARQKREDERMDREFVIGEMLKLAVDLDYADEIGRRKMFQLVREWNPHPPLRAVLCGVPLFSIPSGFVSCFADGGDIR